MISKRQIILNGNLGAGKTAVAKILTEHLGCKRRVSGDFFRDEAERRGVTFPELQKLMKEDLSIDKRIDGSLVSFLEGEDVVVAEARVGPVLAKEAFNVLLCVDEREGAERIFHDFTLNAKRKSEAVVATVEDLVEQNRARTESEKVRYQALYQFDHLNKDLYDLVIDTTHIDANEVARRILEEYRRVNGL